MDLVVVEGAAVVALVLVFDSKSVDAEIKMEVEVMLRVEKT
jgi:hypothetical protein